ncbi:protein JASON-like [Cynara cardunculus var. scolymus]|uniref:protein JASON-like n=1 Tax=Cynara cardunculus var. scolymus TaxID=59895 RepID=UPI000D62E9C3|nr:protein JASON-like [Cynara cardunculus var. scolymus]
MGCFFGCFRVRDDRCPPVTLLSQPIDSNPKDPVASVGRNRLSSLLLSEAEDRDISPCKDRKGGVLGSAVPDVYSNELKAEAKFLKACGTLPCTPAEIRKLKDSEPHNGDAESSTFHSWLQAASIEKLKLEKQPDQQPSPIKLFEEWGNGSDSSSHSPDSCVTVQIRERLYTNSAGGYGVGDNVKLVDVHATQEQNPTASFTPLVASTQCRNKSVRFDREIDASSFSTSCLSEVTCQEPKPYGSPDDYSVSKPSPYPTPLSLTDDMQTPGTVFPSYLHNKAIGKNPRIRSQYVYPVLNPVENAAQLRKLTEESLSSDDCSIQLKEHLDLADKENPRSQVESEAAAADKELTVDTSLSSWLPPKQAHQGRNNRLFLPNSQGLPDFGKTPGDRPILGMVAAHWNADEAASFAPKWWDGNGIPNSTNKYKEDQKVSWHATPFEERLEKALYEDKLVAERKQLGKVPLPPIDLDEKEDRSRLQPSTNLVSF